MILKFFTKYHKTMAQLVYMYSCYPNLSVKDSSLEIATRIQKTRDQEHYHWMVGHAIKAYPKSVMAHQKDRPLFEARTKTNEDTIFLFSVREKNVELYCKAVYKGEWRTYNSLEEAQRTIMNVPDHQKIQNHINYVKNNVHID